MLVLLLLLLLLLLLQPVPVVCRRLELLPLSMLILDLSRLFVAQQQLMLQQLIRLPQLNVGCNVLLLLLQISELLLLLTLQLHSTLLAVGRRCSRSLSGVSVSGRAGVRRSWLGIGDNGVESIHDVEHICRLHLRAEIHQRLKGAPLLSRQPAELGLNGSADRAVREDQTPLRHGVAPAAPLAHRRDARLHQLLELRGVGHTAVEYPHTGIAIRVAADFCTRAHRPREE